ncbi:Transcription elongation factor SPT6 [Phytophthora cinnamomi]|uniref:Transcription elongation factor SPT6 n=1 Tax=Phytophthora cinnamomi TaxID=4785 RepID=UPI00355AABF4|nr:Transcription elongation factor SPT6 [Phytophthora cinnamomi]
MTTSDDELFGAGSPTVSDSDSDAVKQEKGGKKRKLSGKKSKSKSKSKQAKRSASDDEDEKKPKSAFIEDMASESDDGEGGADSDDDDDDDDDGEDRNEYENDGFVVDDEDDEGSDDGETARHRRRRRKKEKKLKRLKQKVEEIDDEDLMLVRENMGMDTGPTHSDSEDEDMGRSSRKVKNEDDSGLMSRELSYRMFGDSDEEEEDSAPQRANNYLGNDEYESDDIDEFIVDDDEEGREGPRRRRKQEPIPASMQGPSVYQMGEAEELFGDMDGFLEATSGKIPEETPAKSKKAILLEKFEPSVLKEHMMTSDVIAVRDNDLPERYQYLFKNREFPDAEDRAEESEWISDFIIKNLERRNQRNSAASRGEIVSAIDTVLRFYHDEKLEPAFVQRYCKEYWKVVGLHTENLYEILDLDVKWDKLERKRRSFQSGIQRVVDSSNAKESAFVRKCYEQLFGTPDEKTYKDLSEFFALDAQESSGQDKESADHKYRRPVRRTFYQICTKAGLRPVSLAFTMNASVLGGIVAGVEHEDSIRDVPTPEESPGVLAQKYTTKEFPTVDDVMKGARHIAASKVAAEPNVRKCIRELYRQNAILSTEATAKGREEVDEFHYCHGLQYIEKMPVLEVFEAGDLWLKIARAEKEGLLKITIINEKAQDLMDPLEPIYLSQGNDSDEEWQSQRHLVLQEAINSFMILSFENELKRDLTVASRDVVVKMCGNALRERLSVRPYEPADGVDPFIVSIWVENSMDSIAHIVALDVNGEMVDKTEGYCKRDLNNIQKLSATLLKFLTEHSQTHVVVINVSAGMKCMDMGGVVDEVRRLLGRDDASRFGNRDGHDFLDIVFLKDDVPNMFSRSKRADQEFPEESEYVRAAIGLGRYLRNPASELCAMWGNVALNEPSRGRELLFLNVHMMQHSLVKDLLLKEYDRVFVQVINKYGVDINLLANHKHTSYQLQFICGLGPAKAASVLDKVRAKNYVERRQELLSKGFVGKIVYRNCAGFIRIRERDALREAPLNPLDDTRIHPESYYMAVKICGDANNNSTIDMYDPNHYSYAVEDTMYQSASAIRSRNAPPNTRLGDAEIQDVLSELDLSAYAGRLELQKKGPKLLTLEYIKRELRYPYFDKRAKYQVPKDEDLFFLLNGETRETLRIGMIVPATLLHMSGDEFVRVRLQSGMRSSLHRERLPDYLSDVRPQTFPKGITVNAKILAIQADREGRYELQLGCNRRSLIDMSMCFYPERFPRYTNSKLVESDSMERVDRLVNEPPVEEDTSTTFTQATRVQGSHPSRRKKRQIAHPLFRNINCQTAMQYLREQPVGEVVIRPSTLGTDHLTLTWKMLDGVYRHFDIQEKDKPSEARIGQTLIIKEEKYENIDELIARFVDPMNSLVEDVVRYKYYMGVPKESVEEDLIKQKKEHPSRIPYALHVYSKFPGCFSITYIARETPRSCHMEVKSGGFRFFGRIESSILPTLSQALQFFKMKALVVPTSSSSRNTSYNSNDRSSGPFAQRSSAPYSGSGGRPRQSSRWDDRRGGDAGGRRW